MNSEPKFTEFLTVREFSKCTRYSEAAVRQKLSKGSWPYYKIDGKTLIAKSFLDELIRTGYRPATAAAAAK